MYTVINAHVACVFKLMMVTGMCDAGAGNMCSASNGGCSHICVPLSQSVIRCICPSPLILAFDKMTCTGTPLHHCYYLTTVVLFYFIF